MCSAVDALALDDWWVMDVGLREGEGRNRRRRVIVEDVCCTPAATGSRTAGWLMKYQRGTAMGFV